MESISTRKDGTGRLNYADFSQWMGNEIHNLASFIFRHDSKRNPHQEQYLKQYEKNKGADKKAAVDALMNGSDLLQKLISKIRQQWSTVNKAFKDFNEDNDEFIDKQELKFFLTHWGFPLNDIQADTVFQYFDKDGDGGISYKDFVESIGFEIHPGETLYFRQEKEYAMLNKDSPCDEPGCWAIVAGRTVFCLSHLK